MSHQCCRTRHFIRLKRLNVSPLLPTTMVMIHYLLCNKFEQWDVLFISVDGSYAVYSWRKCLSHFFFFIHHSEYVYIYVYEYVFFFFTIANIVSFFVLQMLLRVLRKFEWSGRWFRPDHSNIAPGRLWCGKDFFNAPVFRGQVRPNHDQHGRGRFQGIVCCWPSWQ